VTKKPKDYRRRRIEGSSTTGQLNRIYVRDNGICQMCFEPCSRAEASREHVKELHLCTREEARSDDNVILAHQTCNNERSNNLRRSEARRERAQKRKEMPMSSKIGYLLGPEVLARLKLVFEQPEL